MRNSQLLTRKNFASGRSTSNQNFIGRFMLIFGTFKNASVFSTVKSVVNIARKTKINVSKSKFILFEDSGICFSELNFILKKHQVITQNSPKIL